MKKLYKFKFLQINVSLQKIVIVFVLGLLVASNISVHALSTWGIRGNAILGSAQMINSTLSGYGDRTGQTISISKDGNTLAIGSPQHTFAGTGDLAGKVGVYSWNGSAWALKGVPLYAESVGDYFGSAISINADGTALVVGAFGSSANGFNAGQVRVFTFSGSAWTQMGVDIEGTMMNQKVGESVDISADGKTIVVGVSDITNVAQYSGEVRVYTWSGTAWVLKGSAISGEAMDDYFGKKVSISADGTIIAASSPNSDTPASEAGSVRVFSWNGSSWVQQGSNINGRAASNFWGSALKLNSNGSQLAIASPFYDNSGTITGLVAIYTWTGSAWTQKGADILGEGDQYLGNDLALSSTGDTIAIGANGATIVNNTDGAVKTYRWSGSIWEMFTEVVSGNRSEDNFGKSVSLSANGKILAVGASGPDNLLNDGGRAQTYFLTCTGVAIAQQPISQTSCGSNLATLSVSATGIGLSYLWSNGETTQSIQTNTAGNYTVTVNGACQNAVSNTATITALAGTQITQQPLGQTICSNGNATLSVAGTGLNISYLWSNGATTSTITTSTTGTYMATVSGACGAVVSNSIQISNGIPTSITDITPTTAILLGNSATLNVTAVGTGLQYRWSNGVTTVSQSVTEPGEYTVTVIGLCGNLKETVFVGNIILSSTTGGYTPYKTFGGSFSSSRGIFLSANGKVYVVDASNDKISVWTESGNNFTNLTTFGSSGTSSNQFSFPRGISIGNDGKIFISDYDNDRISVWTESGNTFSNLTTFGSYGSANNQLRLPADVWINSADGRIYIAEESNNRISVWIQSGNTFSFLTNFGSQGSATNQLKGPRGVFVNTDGKIFVADASNNRISVWSQSGNSYNNIATFGSEGRGQSNLSYPEDVVVATDGKIYVTDSYNNRISVWTQSGNTFGNLTTFGSGNNNGSFRNIKSITISSDAKKIYITDDSRVNVWNTPAPIYYRAIVFNITAPATFTGSTATLTWPTLLGANTYCIRISKNNDFTTGVRTVCGLTGNSYTYNPNNPNGRTEAGLEEYYWQVAGVDEEGNYSQWSEVQQFSLDATATSIAANVTTPMVSIYPNPNNGTWTLESDKSGELSIMNALGSVVYSAYVSVGKTQISIDLPKGIYIVKLGSKNTKLVIE